MPQSSQSHSTANQHGARYQNCVPTLPHIHSVAHDARSLYTKPMMTRVAVQRIMRGREWLYGLASCGLLLGTTAGWAWAAAGVQRGNADQLVDGFLFADSSTLRGAVFPAAHTQLLKWPVFWLLARLHFSGAAYTILTMLMVVFTIAGLAYLLYRIDRRPLVFGTLYLLLAAALLLVPVDVFDGAVTTPLSLAMLTGRNAEYVMFVAVLASYMRAPRWRSWQFAAATAVYALLVASDQLFLYYGVGGAALCAAAGWLLGWRQLLVAGRYWLAGGAAAWLMTDVLLAAIGHGITHIAVYPLGVQVVHSVFGTWQGAGNAVRAMGLHFGLSVRAGWLTVPAAVVNGVTAALVICAVIWLVRRLWTLRQQAKAHLSSAQLLSCMLLAATATAFVLFAFTNQAELGNARYEAITLVAGFTALATWARSHEWAAHRLIATGCVAALAVIAAFLAVVRHTDYLAHTTLQTRNQQIATALHAHHVAYLVGSYWRVLPIKLLTPRAGQAVMPLEGCFQPTPVLTSAAWRPDLRLHSFAYLVTEEPLDLPGQTCRKQVIMHQYGSPTATLRIAGTAVHPTEELLFYDSGAADARHLIPLSSQCRRPQCSVPLPR